MQFIIVLLIAALSMMAVVLMVSIYVFADAAVEGDIKHSLFNDVRQNMRYFNYTDGKLEIQDEFVFQEDSVFFLILNQDGKVLAGEYPKQFTKEPEIELVTRKVTVNGEDYFVRDVRKNKTGRVHIYARGVVRKEDVYSKYRTLTYLSYLIVFVIYVLALFVGTLFAMRLSASIKDMMRTADTIGREHNISGRMEYMGRYRELKVLAQANNRMLERMEQQFLQQEQFTSDVAHELRTPVAVMLAQCEYARGHLDNREEVEMAFDVIGRQSQKIHSIISKLLYLSRLEQGKTKLDAEEADLVDIVEAVCEDEEEKADGRVKINMHLSPAVARTDINLMSIAIQNIVTNAIKYNGDGDMIDVTTGQKGEQVFVSVRDYGRGIPDEEQSHIFERFYKSDKSRNSEGFGIGLAITKKILEINQGTIEVESVPGRGSMFTLFLPANSKCRTE